jgi:site-specific DNA recombinase
MPKPRAIGYVRVSTSEQANDGYGLDAQERAIRVYCRDAGMRVVRVERDEGESGSNGLETRHGLAHALAALEAGEAEFLIVKRLDRLARDLLIQETVVGRLRQHGRSVLSVEEPDASSDDYTRVLVRQVLGAISQYERCVIQARMAAGKAAKAASGGYVGGRPRYGTRAEGRELIQDTDETAIVEFVHRLRAGGLSYREIASELTREGFRPRTAHQWHSEQVRRIAQSALP